MRDRSKQLLVINTGKKQSGQTGLPSQSGTTHIIGGGGLSVNMSDYLLKSIWDKVWEIRTDSAGTDYIFGKLPVVLQYGLTMYSGEGADIPTLASGLPFDGRTIWYNPDTQQIEVIGGTGGGSGEGVSNFWDLSGIPSWITNSKPKYSYSEIEGTPDLSVYAQVDTLKAYVTLAGAQTLTGEKNFTGGLKVNGSPIIYDSVNKYWKLQGNLVLTGGITMYADDGTLNLPSIYDGLPIDGTTIYWDTDAAGNRVLKAVGGGGTADSVAWNNITGKPSWIGSSKPTYTYSEIQNTPDLSLYAKKTDIPSLSGYATETWVNQQNYATKATTLSGYGITDAYTKTNVDDLLKAYVTLSGSQTITGEKNFVGGLKVNGSPIYYDSTKKYWKLEGDLLVTGGVTMYGNEGTYAPSTIMDAFLYDDTTLGINSNGQLYVKGGAGGGINTTDLQNYLTQNSYLNVTSGDNRYLKLSGGTLSSANVPLYIDRTDSNSYALIGYRIASKEIGYLGFSNNGDFFVSPNRQNGNTNYYTVWHGGNFTPSNYLPLSGGTITGTLAVNENLGVGGTIINKNHYLFARDNANADWIVTNKNWGAEYALIHSGNIGSYNAGSANKLQTPRTIWGQSFDGSGNISGELALGSSYITGFQGINILDSKSSLVILGEGANAKGWTTYINGYNINMRCGSGSSSAMYIDSSLNIGVRTTTPSYNFDVNGTFNATTIYQNGTTLANTYLSLSGGTLTSSNVPLYIDRTDSNSYALIGYRIASKDFGYLGFSNNGDFFVSPNRQNGNTNYYAVWHSGNDGSGSGLDADKLDGVEYQNILERGYSGASRCTGVGWYRIGEFKGTDSNIILLIHRTYNNNAPESYAFSITRVMGTDSYCITQLSGTYSTQIITSIRIDIDWDKNGYIDFYYNTTSGNNVCWTIIGGATAYTAATFNPTTLSVQKTITPIKGFQTSGDILSHGGITMYSMRSLKNVVDERGLSLTELSTIKPTRYTWKDGRDNRLHFGGIADDIQQVLPEVVYSTSDGILTMDYGNAAFAVASSLIQPVVDHEKRIAMLEEENKQLRKEVERLKSA